jgi:hypothetical protein
MRLRNGGKCQASPSLFSRFVPNTHIYNMKKKYISKGVVVNLILSKEFNSRGQVDLMDFQSNPDGKYKFIMVYQDYLTKFCN